MSDSSPSPPRDYRGRTAVIAVCTVLGLATVLALTMALLRGTGVTAPAAPDPRPTRAQLRPVDDQRLRSYEWIDKGQGIVRIPIDLAMQKVIEENQRAKARTTNTN